MTYGDKTEMTQVTKQQQTQIYFDDTRISGSYEVSARTESQSPDLHLPRPGLLRQREGHGPPQEQERLQRQLHPW